MSRRRGQNGIRIGMGKGKRFRVGEMQMKVILQARLVKKACVQPTCTAGPVYPCIKYKIPTQSDRRHMLEPISSSLLPHSL